MARNDTKKFDYLRFSFDFINDKPLKDLMEFSGGKCTMCDYQVILLAAGEKGGTLIYEGIFPTMAEQIAAHLNETTPYKITPEEVNQVLKYFISAGYIKVCGNQYEFLQAPLLIKHETGAARRKRKQRLKHKKVKILTGTLSPDIVTLSPMRRHCPLSQPFRVRHCPPMRRHCPLLQPVQVGHCLLILGFPILIHRHKSLKIATFHFHLRIQWDIVPNTIMLLLIIKTNNKQTRTRSETESIRLWVGISLQKKRRN